MGPHFKAAAIAILSLTALAPAVSAQESIDGTYVDSGGYVEITVARCSNRSTARCGTISRIIRRKPGETDYDQHNDDPALRSRPIVGITLLQNLRWDDGAWEGQVYNPEDGDTYRTQVRPARDGALEVKGCVLFLCRTRIWPRAG